MVSRQALVLGTLWVAGAVFATSVGLVAVQQVGNEVGDQVSSPLSKDAVHRALVSASPEARQEEPQVSEGPEELGPVRTVSTRGGVLGARCHDHEPAVLYATPADGYRTVRSTNGEVRFAGSRYQVLVRLSCDDEALVARTTVLTVGSTAPPRTSPTTPAAEQPGTSSPEPSGHADQGSTDGVEDH